MFILASRCCEGPEGEDRQPCWQRWEESFRGPQLEGRLPDQVQAPQGNTCQVLAQNCDCHKNYVGGAPGRPPDQGDPDQCLIKLEQCTMSHLVYSRGGIEFFLLCFTTKNLQNIFWGENASYCRKEYHWFWCSMLKTVKMTSFCIRGVKENKGEI